MSSSFQCSLAILPRPKSFPCQCSLAIPTRSQDLSLPMFPDGSHPVSGLFTANISSLFLPGLKSFPRQCSLAFPGQSQPACGDRARSNHLMASVRVSELGVNYFRSCFAEIRAVVGDFKGVMGCRAGWWWSCCQYRKPSPVKYSNGDNNKALVLPGR